MYFVILFVVGVLTILLTTLTNQTTTSTHENIGNVVLEIMTTSKTPNAPTHYKYTSKDPNKQEFYESLQQQFIEKYSREQLIGSPFNRLLVNIAKFRWIGHNNLVFLSANWIYDSQSIADYWASEGAAVRTIIEHSVKKPDIQQNLVIHLRLGDIPFNQNRNGKSMYHLQKYSYYKWALDRLKPDTKTITLIYSNTWNTTNNADRHSSDEYSNRLKSFLQELGYVVKIQSESAFVDFQTMVWAKYFIGSTGTFSFFSCIGRDPATFCMPQLGYEYPGKYYIHKPLPDWMSPIEPVLHANAPDYHDIDAVAVLLNDK
jgi:hypothetical protein